MKPREIKAGTFLVSKKGDRIREILHIGALTGFQGEYVFYVDEGSGGFCGLSAMATWAGGEVRPPQGWLRPECDIVWLLRSAGKLPEQHGVAPSFEVAFSKDRSDLARAIVYNAFRNTDLENIHAGIYPPPGSKVVTPDGVTIPWENVSHISDRRMKALMIDAVNKVYTILSFPRLQFRRDDRWNDAVLDDEMMTGLAYSGLFGEVAQAAASAKLAKESLAEEDSDLEMRDPPSP